MDKAALFAAILPQEVVDTDFGPITVRSLSRAEVFALKKSSGVDEDAMDVLVLTSGMVGPPLTEAEVREWRAVAPAGAVEPVMQAIMRLSGLGEGAPKSVGVGVPEGQ